MFSLPASLRWRHGRDGAGADGASPQMRVVKWGLGHDPGRVVVRAGAPICLVFERLDSDVATECVSIPALGRVVMLRPRSRVLLDPCEPGEYVFCSRDGELQGVLVVQPRGSETRGHSS